jgi:hypothetical protein
MRVLYIIACERFNNSIGKWKIIYFLYRICVYEKCYIGDQKFEKFPKVPIYCICIEVEGLLAPTHLDYDIKQNKLNVIGGIVMRKDNRKNRWTKLYKQLCTDLGGELKFLIL